ncbi:MAG: tRNA (5-methylaminomethyl-2-thiouridylate)-methyltransferase [Candidatus Cloacimonadaceae bacterium]|jgi:tRNA U34 2-thiouridine synthase MnmA/TrmU|nr:tRNA (5-methylaminomethyl-2-thiouridylate)-methyltransferase [Candidatus Cloacimonadota bacterium]MDX9950442.1 tRNA (5-methylaminomethyl-2-thiouridylate)-methyltransferase [Candidatus Syntrophosphaera sp.]
MNNRSAIALFSGGLDSILAVKILQEQGIKVHPVFFSTPYIYPDRALKFAAKNGLQLDVFEISSEHLEMMKAPRYGFGKRFNPCIDCHGLMFAQAAALLPRYEADFLVSGEVVGQRPMSQRREALQSVGKLSGNADLIVRPLSQKLLPDTLPIREGWVDKNLLLDISGRGRQRQMELAKKYGLNFPGPGGGCLLTDPSFSLRLRELVSHGQETTAQIALLRWGRHFRLSPTLKLIVGRHKADNERLYEQNFPGLWLRLRDSEGPLGLLTDTQASSEQIALAASILLFYANKAPSPAWVKYSVDNKRWHDIEVEKCPETLLRGIMITVQKDLRC